MNALNRNDVNLYVNEHIVDFHQARIEFLEELRLDDLLRANLYLLHAKNIWAAGEFVGGLLDNVLVSFEEKLFSDFLQRLAIFVAGQTCNGRKSTIPGIDLEFEDREICYIVAIKVDPDWGSASQRDVLAGNLQKAAAHLRQAHPEITVQPVLGMCCGKTRTSFLHDCLIISGQNFWYFISHNKSLYADIIEAVGYYASKHAELFDLQKAATINRFTKEFIERFCDEAGMIDWKKLVAFNSGNYDLDKFDDAVDMTEAAFKDSYDPVI